MNGPGTQLNRIVGANQPPRKKIEIKLKIKELIMFEEKKGYYLNKSIL